MNKTGIEYLTHTWSPIAMRCTKISEACEECWHLRTANRLSANYKIPHNIRLAYSGNAPPVLVESRRDHPLKRKKPARIGVQFMGDLFHEDVPNYMIDDVFERIRQAQHHTFLILTKRLKQLYKWADSTNARSDDLLANCPNLWLGVTAENQQRADERIPTLLQIPAAVRFLSLEPLLGPIDLHFGDTQSDVAWRQTHGDNYQREFISWVIIGGLSLPGGKIQKPSPHWVMDIVNQCDAANIPVFIKPNAQYPEVRRDFPGGSK